MEDLKKNGERLLWEGFAEKGFKSGVDKFHAFMTLAQRVRRHRTDRQTRLHHSLTYSQPFAAAAVGQLDVFFFIEAAHLGQLQHVLLECRSDGKARIRSILRHAARC